MLRFEIDVTAADQESRVIEGIAVPYGEVASLGGQDYRFTKGSLRAARPRTPLLLSHDSAKPVGVLAALEDTDGGAIARFKIDEGPDGDLALIQAASGSRGGLSIGATVVQADADEDGINVVTEASLFEVSLVTIPAFASADVLSVAAEADPEPNEEPGDPADTTPQEESDMEPNEAPEPVAAEHPAITVTAERQPELTAGEYVQHMIRADRGDAESQRIVRAALSGLTTATEPGLVPPAYSSQIINEVPNNRPWANNIRRATLPATGMKIIKPDLTQPADGSWVSEGAATPSNAFAVGTHEVQVLQWAYGVSMSLALAERGEGAAEAVYRSAVTDYYNDVEAAVMTEIGLQQIATKASAGAGKILEDIGLGAAEVYSGTGRKPDKVAISPATWAALLPSMGPLAYTGGSTSAATIAGQISGLDIVVTPTITNTAIYVYDSSVIELRESSPIQLRANVVGTMSIEFGVSSFMSLDIETPLAICRVGAAPTK